MPPTTHDHPQTPSSQNLPVLTEPVDPTSIVPTVAVEAPSQESVISAEPPTQVSPVEQDFSNVKVTRPDLPDPKNAGAGPLRRVAAGLMGVAVFATGGAGANHLLGETAPVRSSDRSTEQLQSIDSGTSPSTIAVDRPNQVSLSGVGEVDSVTKAPADQNGSDDPSNSQPELLSHANSGVLPVDLTNNTNSVGTPGANSEVVSSVPAGIEKDVVGAQEYPGQITVIRSVSLAEFLMNNQEKTGIAPTIEVSNEESGIITFSDPNGNVVIVSGNMIDGNIIVDDKMPMSGIGAITIIDSKGNQVTVKSSKDPNSKPATNVTKKGQNSITTDQVIFPGSTLDAQGASDEGAQITADIKGYFEQNFQKIIG